MCFIQIYVFLLHKPQNLWKTYRTVKILESRKHILQDAFRHSNSTAFQIAPNPRYWCYVNFQGWSKNDPKCMNILSNPNIWLNSDSRIAIWRYAPSIHETGKFALLFYTALLQRNLRCYTHFKQNNIRNAIHDDLNNNPVTVLAVCWYPVYDCCCCWRTLSTLSLSTLSFASSRCELTTAPPGGRVVHNEWVIVPRVTPGANADDIAWPVHHYSVSTIITSPLIPENTPQP